MNWLKGLISLLLVSLLIGCSGGGVSGLFTEQEKNFVYGLFKSEYLWYDEVAEDVDLSSYSEPQALVEALRVTPPDKWSFSMTVKEYNDYSNQASSGFGFGYFIKNFQIYFVRVESPVYDKLKRGDKILKIDNKDVTEELIKTASKNEGVESIFHVDRAGVKLDIAVTPIVYSYKVALAKVINHGSKKIGYLRYDAFTSSSTTEIESAFSKFHTAGVDELVIDLRYNHGGSVLTAGVLLDNITNAYLGERQIYLDWNKNYKIFNSTYYFDTQTDGNELDMSRVFFLTTGSSASASELVISALKPYLGESNIITIGEATAGKPVGMSSKVFGLNYYFLINFVVRNDAGVMSSFDGIDATCSADDDLTHQRGDTQESMLSVAISYIDNDKCP